MPPEPSKVSAVLAAMADGVGDLTFASPQWVEMAQEALGVAVGRHAAGLANLGRFTLCEVAHNPPAYLHGGSTLSWHAQFDGATVRAASGELPTEQCDLKIEADHSILSNLARLQFNQRDPQIVVAAQRRLTKLSRWKVSGHAPAHEVLAAVLRSLHDALAARTMPRFVYMTPEWVSTARYILCKRATSEKYSEGIRDVTYTFAEEFTDTPPYAFPDGSHGGFWVRCDHGQITVGAGPLPPELGPADTLTVGMYTPIVPIGRTVNAAMTDTERAEQETYTRTALRFDKTTGRAPVTQSSPSGRGIMPPALARIFLPLHDELSKRTSGELPADFDSTIEPQWSSPQKFDRREDYDSSWLRYDRVDIYGAKRA